MNNVSPPTNGRPLKLRWVVWRNDELIGKDGKPVVGDDGKPKTVKVPYDPKTGRRASSTNPGTWGSQDEAKQGVATYGGDGIGIVLGQIDTGDLLCGIDLDTCRDPETGVIASWAQEVADRFKTYTEISPSETGVKAFFNIAAADREAVETLLGKDQYGKQKRSLILKKGGGEHPPAIEVYIGGRYFTVTWRGIYPETDIRCIDLADLEWLINEAGPKFKGNGGNGVGRHDNGPAGPAFATRDDSRSTRAMRAGVALVHAGKSYEEMREALLKHEDPGIPEWVQTKGTANGEREMRRIFDKAKAASGNGAAIDDPEGTAETTGLGSPAGGTVIISVRAPYDTARLFQSRLTAPLQRHRSSFYEWDGRAWPEVSDESLRSKLYRFLDECRTKVKVKTEDGETTHLRPVKPDTKMVGNVFDALRAAAHLNDKITPPAWISSEKGPAANTIVACANGLLHLPTRKLLPHTPSFFNYNALDCAYDPNAPKPLVWLNFLDQLWPDDAEAIDTLQETFGYCLTPDTSQQKAFLLIGPSRSGKGTANRVLTQLIGERNCVAPTLSSLGTTFGLEPLIGKQLATITDARLGARADQGPIVEQLLSITGEDPRTIPRKNKLAWTGKLQTRFMVLANELPRLADASDALANRFIILLLRNSFLGREDIELTNKLLTELPGILNWAVEGWARLTKHGRFTQPKSSKEIEEQLEDLSSPVGEFVHEKCEVGVGYSVGTDHLYSAWKGWCMTQGREHAGTSTWFGRDLRAAVPSLKRTRPKEGGDRVYEYQGLRLIPPTEDASKEAPKSVEEGIESAFKGARKPIPLFPKK